MYPEKPFAGFRVSARGGLYKIPTTVPVIPANPLDRLNDKPLYNVCLGTATSPLTTNKGTRVFKYTKPRVTQLKPLSPHCDGVSLHCNAMSPHRDVRSPLSSARAAPHKDKLQKLLRCLKQHVLRQTDPKLRMLCASLIAQYVKALHHYS